MIRRLDNAKEHCACSCLFALKFTASDVLGPIFFLWVGHAYADSPLHPSVDRTGTAEAFKMFESSTLAMWWTRAQAHFSSV